jgi:hypothetical protein
MTQGDRCDSQRPINYFWTAEFYSTTDLSLLCADCFYRSAQTFSLRVDLCPIVHGPLSFAQEPFSFTNGLFLSGYFGFAFGPFSTSQVDRFLLQNDVCLSLDDLFVRAGLLSTICRLLFLTRGPTVFIHQDQVNFSMPQAFLVQTSLIPPSLPYYVQTTVFYYTPTSAS